MEPLYHQTNRMLQDIEQHFQQLLQKNGPSDSQEVENAIQVKMAAVNSNCDRLDVLLYKVPASQRQTAKMRVDQLKYDLRHLQSSLQMYREKEQRRAVELNEREQLLSHRNATHNTDDGTAAETRLEFDYALKHNQQLGSAHQGVDDMLASGTSILGSLVNQRETLKNAHRRIMTIGSTLGLSNHTMKLIERRFSEDKYVMLGGMLVTLLIIGLVVYFVIF